MDVFTVAFFGHRYLNNPLLLDKLLDEHLRILLSTKAYVQFLVGRNGEFDQCAASAVRRAKRNYRDDNNALVLVLPYSTAEYRHNVEAFERYYDNIEIFHLASNAHPKSAIQLRNQEMVDRADLILCYAETCSGGAYRAVTYTKKQGKDIINLAESLK